MMARTRRSIALVLMAALAGPVAAQDTRTIEVRFAPGTTGATYSGEITGYASVDYYLQAGVGQTMKVELQTSNLSNYFNVWAPGADAAMFVGASSGDRFSGQLPVNGRYRIQVFLMRNAARREETARYSLDISITDGAGATPTDFADGLAGGPDWYVVSDLPPQDSLNVRAGPGTGHDVVGTVSNGAELRKFGCRSADNSRWCQIENAAGSLRGWVNGRYLREGAVSAAPGGAAGAPPELLRRDSGEFEVRFDSGCTLLFAPAGSLITAGSSCSAEQSIHASKAVDAYRREQGL
ncbi:SH3 domain-containing protein [Alloyangia pacifica]|uniref:SH3 domain-containing protein n=1 Tax=Alloyangia pacifica TaxID=311180 RepID=UPI00131EDDC8|nr:SH3 domain-containing protein [Alloyangia pacifica]